MRVLAAIAKFSLVFLLGCNEFGVLIGEKIKLEPGVCFASEEDVFKNKLIKDFGNLVVDVDEDTAQVLFWQYNSEDIYGYMYYSLYLKTRHYSKFECPEIVKTAIKEIK